MVFLCSCRYSPRLALNLTLVLPLARSLFPAKPSPLRPLSRSSSLPPNRRMSAKPSAFDALMSGARAAAAANKKPRPPSPKKRKSLDPAPVENPSDDSKSDSVPAEANVDQSETIEGGNQLIEVKGSNAEKCPEQKKAKQSEGSEKSAKKGDVSAERVKGLKSKIHLLKKKPTDFSPESVACWSEGERVPFIFLCLAFDLISNETGRIVITDIVCNALRTVMNTTPDDLVAVVYLLANRIAPAHEGLELGIGDASIIKALAEACGRTEVQIKKQYKELGDLGLVAKASRSSQSTMRKPDALTLAKVFDTFRLIAKLPKIKRLSYV